jgi:hypothetical protein
MAMQTRGLALWAVLPLALAACTDQTTSSVVDQTDPLLAENGLSSNGLSSNGLSSNGLSSNGLSSNGLSSNGLVANAVVLTALRDTSATGALTRTFFSYLISCALPASSTVTYTWTDTAGVVHTVNNPGSLGLAPYWETGPVDQTGEEIVSACLGARTNSLGVHVPLSMRANGVAALAVSDSERSTYTYGEGSFWGNLFNGGHPYLYSCSRAPYDAGTASSQYTSQGRTCAASNCGIITYVGRCLASDHSTNSQACFNRDKANDDWSSDCFPSLVKAPSGGAMNVITTWLMP